MTRDIARALDLAPGRVARLVDPPPGWAARLTAASAAGVTWEESGSCDWLLAFVPTRAALAERVEALTAPLAEDGLLWIAHPRGPASELTRETGWRPLIAAGFEADHAVALDEHWMARRFRRRHGVGVTHGGRV